MGSSDIDVGAAAGSAPAAALGGLTWPEAGRRAARGAVLAVPLGSTEQHGPHLPLSTDTDVAVALARRLAVATAAPSAALTTPPAVARPEVVIAPAVGYGASGEHAGFAGTVSIGAAALETMLVELGRSAADTFHHMVFVSTHGGNDEPVRAATVRLRAESRDVLAWFASGTTVPDVSSVAGITEPAAHGGHRFGADEPAGSAPATGFGATDGGDSGTGYRRTDGSWGSIPTATAASTGVHVAGDAHAGRVETSIQLALDPARVRTDLAAAGNRAPLAELMPALRADGISAVSANGVLGDPAGASAAEGAALLDRLTANLCAAVGAWLSADSPPSVAGDSNGAAR